MGSPGFGRESRRTVAARPPTLVIAQRSALVSARKVARALDDNRNLGGPVGLDLVELVIATEAAFGIAIPDAIARELTTPRRVIDYLTVRLPTAETSGCLTQRAFYRLRGAMARRFERPPTTLVPETRIAEVLPPNAPESHWRQLGAELGADRWPKFREARWLGRYFDAGPSTLGDTAAYLATWYPAAVKGADSGWTQREIELAFLRLLVAETGVDMSRHTLDSRFYQDMGLD
jgi:acyl carrier protein